MLAQDLLTYVLTGLERGDTCLIIATPEVLIRLQKGLRNNHIDVAAALRTGQYIIRDAEEVLTSITRDHHVDPALFSAEIGKLFIACHQRQQPIRVFGEMVALLARQERVESIAHLERYWHDFTHTNPCSLYCAYPNESLERIPDSHLVDDIKGHHDMVASGVFAHS